MEKACALISKIDGVFIYKAENSEQAYRYALEYHIDLFIVDIKKSEIIEIELRFYCL